MSLRNKVDRMLRLCKSKRTGADLSYVVVYSKGDVYTLGSPDGERIEEEELERLYPPDKFKIICIQFVAPKGSYDHRE